MCRCTLPSLLFGSVTAAVKMASTGGSDDDLSDWEGPVDIDLDAPPSKQMNPWSVVTSVAKWVGVGKNKKLWTQLAGHQGSFQAGESQTVLKKLLERERQCYVNIQCDLLKDFTPEYRGEVQKQGETYLQLQDLLSGFTCPCVMDVKMGCRTYHEEELKNARENPVFRKDIYRKMTDLDPDAPTPEEREKGGVTKARYLRWRDEMSSSVNLSFRIEGIRKDDGSSSKDFKRVNRRNQVREKFRFFLGGNKIALEAYLKRLEAIKAAEESSEFFSQHELVGSSLLFVHDSEKANIWIIDFGKTLALPAGVKIDHRTPWVEGNHEDEYLKGLENLIAIFTELANAT
ncbi:inositol-trisphosphate 3-kinase A-like [Haliotis rufescens]|uniref:inositol-trisphosphate 3-kinase A-like n=1 Tax=Haliotis rufescens TaxID=6454 RepID=UPI00201F7609|nr:inositol-trisphosphate 3-kinase A-like [Haliotis rufescens]